MFGKVANLCMTKRKKMMKEKYDQWIYRILHISCECHGNSFALFSWLLSLDGDLVHCKRIHYMWTPCPTLGSMPDEEKKACHEWERWFGNEFVIKFRFHMREVIEINEQMHHRSVAGAQRPLNVCHSATAMVWEFTFHIEVVRHTDSHTHALFRTSKYRDSMTWVNPVLAVARLRHTHPSRALKHIFHIHFHVEIVFGKSDTFSFPCTLPFSAYFPPVIQYVQRAVWNFVQFHE